MSNGAIPVKQVACVPNMLDIFTKITPFKHFYINLKTGQMLLQTSAFPSAFKKALVVPVPKKPGACSPDEHRPIALLSLVSKMIERIVYDQVYAYVEPLLHECQTGFRRGLNTEAALIRI